MALFDEKFYLEVIQGYISEDTKKARRNLSVTAFIISVIYLLEFKLQDLKIFGLSMKDQDSNALTWTAIVLLAYWILVYIVQLVTDHQVNKEKQTQLGKNMAAIKYEYDRIHNEQLEREKAKNSKGERPPLEQSETIRQKEIETEYRAYLSILERTRVMQILLTITKVIHTGIPFILSIYAYSALRNMF